MTTQNNIWDQIQNLLKEHIGESSFESWIKPLEFSTFDAGILTLAAPTRFMADFIEKNYLSSITSFFNTHFSDITSVKLHVYNKKLKIPAVNEIINAAPTEDLKASNENAPQVNCEFKEAENPEWMIESILRKEFTFDNFVVDESNQFAYAAAKKIAEGEELSFNPLFLYAGVGLGKTHLMHAIANEIEVNDPKRRVLYMSAQKFMVAFVRALKENQGLCFKDQFKHIDLLLIDDLQFIDNKGSTQKEFFQIFRDLVNAGKQVVLCANRAPSSLDGIDKAFKSRLISGLVADMGRPNYEMRLKILKAKRTLLGKNIDDAILKLLAEKISSNTRELEGALRRIVAYSDLTNTSINQTMAQYALKDILVSNERKIEIEEIQKQTAKFFGLEINDLKSARRGSNLVYARQIAMFLCKQLTPESYPSIARKFGGRDHATVMYACKKIEEKKINAHVKQDIEIIEAKCFQ